MDNKESLRVEERRLDYLIWGHQHHSRKKAKQGLLGFFSRGFL